jgi:hypothetical protein
MAQEIVACNNTDVGQGNLRVSEPRGPIFIDAASRTTKPRRWEALQSGVLFKRDDERVQDWILLEADDFREPRAGE